MESYLRSERNLQRVQEEFRAVQKEFDETCAEALQAREAKWKKSQATKSKDIALLYSALNKVKNANESDILCLFEKQDGAVIQHMEEFLEAIGEVKIKLKSKQDELNEAKLHFERQHQSFLERALPAPPALSSAIPVATPASDSNAPVAIISAEDGQQTTILHCVRLLETILLRQQMFEAKVERQIQDVSRKIDKLEMKKIKFTNETIRLAVNLWCDIEKHGRIKYGDISTWNTSEVTDMRELFNGKTTFNADISQWNVSNVTNMRGMFHGASSFNQPLHSWDVSNVTNLVCLFSGASSFNQPLDSWNVSNVTNMGCLFSRASSFNQPLHSWDVSNVTNMKSMFNGASSFNQPLDSWDVSKVIDMKSMFNGSPSHKPAKWYRG